MTRISPRSVPFDASTPSAMPTPPESDRLRLRPFTDADAPFVRDLVTQPAWLEWIGDRGVQTDADALAFIRDRLDAHHREHGFGFWLVERKPDGAPLGMCGLIDRPGLDGVDLGYALHPDHWGQGYAREAARATAAWARDVLGLARLCAIVTPGNAPSVRVLEAVGLRRVGAKRLPGADGEPDDVVDLYAVEWAADAAGPA